MVALAFVLAVVVFAAPLLVTARFSRRAVDEGEQGGSLPLIVASVSVAGFVVLNLAAGILQLVS